MTRSFELDASGEARGRWRALAGLALGCFLGMCSWFSASAVLRELTVFWQIPPGKAGFVTMAVQLGFVAGALVSAGANLADLVPPRRLVLFGAAGAALANLGLLSVSSLEGAVPLRFLTGFGLAFVYPPYLKIAATWFRAGRGTALGVMLGGLTVGSAAPHLIKALGGADWRTVIVATSVASLCGGLLAAFVSRDGPHPFAKAVFAPRQALELFRHRGLRLGALGYFGHMWELYAMWAWFPLFATERFAGQGYGAQAAAWYAFAVVAGGALGCWLGGRYGDGWGRTRVTRLALALSGSSAALVGFAALPFPLFLAIGGLWGLAVNADSAQFTTIASEIGDQAYVGTVVTMQLALGFLLTNATLWTVPWLSAHYGWGMAFLALAPGPFAGAMAMRALARSPYAALIAGGRG